MTIRRRAMLALAAAPALPALVQAQVASWPQRPVRVVVPYPPGGSNDAVARPLAEIMQRRLGQPFVIDNKPGAGSTIGSAEVARAPADGQTLMVTSSTFATSAAVQRTPYDAAQDFEMVALLATAPLVVIAAPNFPANNLAQAVTYIRANPGRVDYGSSGPGSINQLATELFAREAGGLQMSHVPYRGMGPATTDLVAGTIQLIFTTMPSAAGVIQGGRVKVLGWTSEQRPANGPAAPTPRESGLPNYEAGIWWGLLARRGLPPEVRSLINATANEALADPRLANYLASEGARPGSGDAASADRFLQADLARWKAVATAANIRVE
ncbi:tripartite tricarboxylate transporter substrate binding protein [Roseomonas stagni]|uniref:Tripartite tricarboxylate transporter substrate binding protein n=1 Tax=Falsiroseomonas algicola TaxID=2716930 RepID=A0A6M1LEG1_9PROT|nr:tripartite tricarboxylate transporter substrate-binding protein [Falsiroseomonas algicola]NGM18675.1 tripartite tricarboxylate transporter substrate binding protein [Falsiroseomonas algicola]